MASKLERISALSTETTRHLTDTPETWMRFLDSAAWFYKYSFADQVLIAAQRPDATACAELELWNRVFNRWVNRGAKGIALIDDSGDRPHLRYVFDVKDTNNRYGAAELRDRIIGVEERHIRKVLWREDLRGVMPDSPQHGICDGGCDLHIEYTPCIFC